MSEERNNVYKEVVGSCNKKEDQQKLSMTLNGLDRPNSAPGRIEEMKARGEPVPKVHFVKDDVLHFMESLPSNLTANLSLVAIDAIDDNNFVKLFQNIKRVIAKGNLLILYGPITLGLEFPQKDDSLITPEFRRINEIEGIKISDIDDYLYIYQKEI